MKIYITGDLHGATDMFKLSSSRFPEGKQLTKDDIVIVCGDFGLLFHYEYHRNYEHDQKHLRWLADKQWTTLFVDGNHDCFDLLDDLPQVDVFGSKAGKVRDNIFHLKRGNIYTIDNKKFLAIGGASSVDKLYREASAPGYGQALWWEGELWNKEQENNCLDNLDNNDWKVDYVISHTAPDVVIEEMFKDHWSYRERLYDPTARFFNFLYKQRNLEFKQWFFGHFHDNRELDKFKCLYNNIINLEM